MKPDCPSRLPVVLIRLCCLLGAMALRLVAARTVDAHPADMYFHGHTVMLTAHGIELVWDFAPGPSLAQYVWYTADTDRDELVSHQEASVWVQSAIPSFHAELERHPLGLKLASFRWPNDVEALTTGDEPIRMVLTASWDLTGQAESVLTLDNAYDRAASLSVFEIRAEEVAFKEPEQDGGIVNLIVSHRRGDAVGGWQTTWESGRPNVPWALASLGLEEVAATASDQAQATSSTASVLEGLVRRGTTSLTFLSLAMAIAALLGALHALSPGHGKTVVAAYLVGSQGKVHHAVALGAIVTVTHTGSVFALGTLTLTASRYLLASNLLPAFELASGALIALLGVGLLVSRLRGFLAERRERRASAVEPATIVPDAGGGGRVLIHQPICEAGPKHSHDPSQYGYLPRGPSPRGLLSQVRWRSLITLGIGGGLVPCPDAIAILLIAAALNRIALGLSLILAFSVGLALVLVAIGLLIVQGKRLFRRLSWFDRVAAAMPVVSAVAVIVLGAVLTSGAARRLSVAQANAAGTTFRQVGLHDVRVIYMGLDEAERYQLFVVPASGGGSVQMTSEPGGVWDYAVSPHSRRVVYAAVDGTRATRLVLLSESDAPNTTLLTCTNAFCSGPVWSPDGQGLIYSRLEVPAKAGLTGYPSLWWLDFATHATEPLFSDAHLPALNPRWSPDGRWLSYVSITPRQVSLYNLETGERQYLPSQAGQPAIWSPGADAVLLVDLADSGEMAIRKLYRYDVVDKNLSAVVPSPDYSETYPAWSPDGAWVATVRRSYGQDVPATDQQIWLMRPDGTDAHRVASHQQVALGQPAWSPDGRFLVYALTPLAPEGGQEGIRILDTLRGGAMAISPNGSRPAWLP